VSKGQNPEEKETFVAATPSAVNAIPPFDWEAWYDAVDGRSASIPEAKRLLDHVYGEQAPRFDAKPNAPLKPFGSPDEAAAFVKQVAIEAGADAVGIAEILPEDVYAGRQVSETFAIAVGQKMRWREFQTVPSDAAAVECIRIYVELGDICLAIADALRARGYPARVEDPVGDSDLMHVPIALRAGFGELGRHGSIIHPELGPFFRLGTVVTNVSLTLDAPVDLGIAEFCDRCRACRKFCPADAIPDERDPAHGLDPIGKVRYVVDTGRCFPYFAKEKYCSVCLAICAYKHKEWARDHEGRPTKLKPEIPMRPAPPRVDPSPSAGKHRYPRLKVISNRGD